ncbi:hypothetical protein Tco_0174447 [Tanacetum coccineum]
MAETMEQYMSKTRADYGLGVARTKIEDKDNFKLKGQFLKELRDNTFSDQVMLRAFPYVLNCSHKSLAKKQTIWFDYNLGIFEDKEVVLFYNGLDVPTRQILNSRGAIPSKTVADAKMGLNKKPPPPIQEMRISQNAAMEHPGPEVLKLLTD